MTKIIKVGARAIRNKDDGVWDLYITCPFCGKKHHHGGGNGQKPLYGPRVAHCLAGGGFAEYELVAAK